jgi:hypothetical protein
MRRPSAVLLLAALAAAACQRQLPQLPKLQLPDPPPAAVQSVIFMIGDAGKANERRDPVFQVLRADVERWSAALARDSAVMVLFLGDIIYPEGMHPREDQYWASDSAAVQTQVNIVAGPNARRFGAIGYFMAGNHDWGNARDHTGVRRLQNHEELLDRRRAEGIHVRLQPKAGEAGPAVIDYGATRLLLFDTAWWLLAREEELKQPVTLRTQEAIRSAGARNVVVAAHHPFRSASPHGGLIPFWKGIGLRYVLNRSGAVLQDLNSTAYRDLLAMMRDAFALGRPLVFAGGHDHSMQVIEEWEEQRAPRYSLVIGSASKSSPVGHFEGMRYRTRAPGYMRMITLRDGTVQLFVIAAPDEDYLRCEVEDPVQLQACMARMTAAFRMEYALRLE